VPEADLKKAVEHERRPPQKVRESGREPRSQQATRPTRYGKGLLRRRQVGQRLGLDNQNCLHQPLSDLTIARYGVVMRNTLRVAVFTRTVTIALPVVAALPPNEPVIACR
jgi:hypothetical protein